MALRVPESQLPMDEKKPTTQQLLASLCNWARIARR